MLSVLNDFHFIIKYLRSDVRGGEGDGVYPAPGASRRGAPNGSQNYTLLICPSKEEGRAPVMLATPLYLRYAVV